MIRHEIDLRSRLLPVRDQGPRPTCAAYAASGAHEFVRGEAEHLSPEYLYYFARLGAGRGCSLPSVAAALAGHGQPLETECPAFAADPDNAWHPPRAREVFKRQSEQKTPSVGTVHDVVRRGETPILGLVLPDSFFRPEAPWVIRDAGPVRGRHAVVAVGSGEYQRERVVLVRNSWGEGWADGGHAWLPDSFLSQRLVGIVRLTGDKT